MNERATIRLVDIAELLSVSKQRAHQIAGETGFPAPVAKDAADGSGIGGTFERGRSGGARRDPGANGTRPR